MKLYLSSYQIGNKGQKLTEMVDGDKKIMVIPNALDFATDIEIKAKSIQGEVDSLTELGLKPEVLDLKDYFGKSHELKEKIGEYDAIWLRGGNAFVLRRAMAESGLDQIIIDKQSDQNFVYGGYSAGVCVLGPTMNGYELVDDKDLVQKTYGKETLWEGLNIVNYHFAPHYKSNHPESNDIDKVVQYFIENKMLFKALKDGEVIIQ